MSFTLKLGPIRLKPRLDLVCIKTRHNETKAWVRCCVNKTKAWFRCGLH